MKLHRSIHLLAFGLLLLVLPAALSTPSSAAEIGVGISVKVEPPALPVYEQPICPGPGHLWTPGYWAWSADNGYYWVPGTWVVAPVGMLWTPGYWGWHDGLYAWHAGYWGPHIGFYGGVNYGFGYGGVGFVGGEWRHGAFFYNTAVMHVDRVHFRNLYENRKVIVRNESHVAFNGGKGGIDRRPSREEEKFSREPHRAALAEQTRHEHAASQNHALFASANHGRPAIAATGRPGEFKGHSVVASKAAGAPHHAPAISPKQAHAPSSAANHSNSASLKAANHTSASNNAKVVKTSHESAPHSQPSHLQSNAHAVSAPKPKTAPAAHQSAPSEKHSGKGR